MNTILVLGGTGFVGAHVCEKLVRAGWHVTVPTRRRANARHILHLPGLTVLETNVHDPAALARAVQGHQAVVNLVAVLHGNAARFNAVHVALPQSLAQACSAAHVRQLVHVSALGANPTPLPFPELYAALEQKAVDGQENPVATIQGAKLFEVQKHMVLTNHQYNPQSVVISKKFWDSLAPTERKLLQEAAVESARFQREQSRSAAAGILESLKKAGMQVTELPPAEMAKLREKIKPVIAKHTANVGEATVKAVLADIEAARK